MLSALAGLKTPWANQTEKLCSQLCLNSMHVRLGLGDEFQKYLCKWPNMVYVVVFLFFHYSEKVKSLMGSPLEYFQKTLYSRLKVVWLNVFWARFVYWKIFF